MKKLIIFAFAVLGMLACSDQNGPGNGGGIGSKDISCDVQTLSFVSDVQTTKSITLTASGEWSASTNVTWLTIDPVNGHGSAFVNITCQTGNPAEGKIIFSTNKSSVQVTVYREGSYYPKGFWVSSTKQVTFSQGNLQYQPSSKTWKFAEHQYDAIGESNKNVINDNQSTGWMDIFAWGTSAYRIDPTGVICVRWDYSPFSSTTDPKWRAEESPIYNDDIAGTNYDWGVYNKISNGGNQAGIWRTLTKEEWDYLLDERPNAKNLRGFATVNRIKGVILLPNGWQTPDGLSFKSSSLTLSSPSRQYDDNLYNLSDWKKMEQAGAIFLPCTGYGEIWMKYNTYTLNAVYYEIYYTAKDHLAKEYIKYWTSTHSHGAYENEAYVIDEKLTENQRLYQAVRLVKDID